MCVYFDIEDHSTCFLFDFHFTIQQRERERERDSLTFDCRSKVSWKLFGTLNVYLLKFDTVILNCTLKSNPGRNILSSIYFGSVTMRETWRDCCQMKNNHRISPNYQSIENSLFYFKNTSCETRLRRASYWLGDFEPSVQAPCLESLSIPTTL